jgi:hypothetical protein
MRSAFPPPNPAVDGQNGNNPQNGQNGGNGQNGNNGRRGPNFRDPAFRDAMQKFMERPETKAKMEEIRTQNDKILGQVTAEVNRVLGRRSALAYKKMLGAPFDLTRLTGGPGQGNRNGNTANAASKVQASGADAKDAATAKPAPKTNSSSTSKAKRKSLRELRGLE